MSYSIKAVRGSYDIYVKDGGTMSYEYWMLDSFGKEQGTLRAQLAEAQALLRQIEFADTGGLDGPGYCSICGCRGYHDGDCRLGIALKDVPE